MKKIIITVIIILSILFITFKFNKNEFDTKKWYVEITNDYINIRSDHILYSDSLGQVKKGQKYYVEDIFLEDNKYFWYKIKISKNKTGWIANPKKNNYLIDYNNPNDILKPTLKFNDDVYYVNSINDINYKHLEVKDDKDFKISHEVFYEKEKNQYWIVYTVTDSVENKISKTQKIVFKVNPKNLKEWK